MKRWLKRVLVIFLLLILVGIAAIWLASEPRPTGTPGPAAEALAKKMQNAVNVGYTITGTGKDPAAPAIITLTSGQ